MPLPIIEAGEAAAEQAATAAAAGRASKAAGRAMLWKKLGKAYAATLNAGWQFQAWESLFDEHGASVTNSATVTAVGSPGTPSKNVMHVALAVAFGVLSRYNVARFGDVGLKIDLDHMTNTVQVGYAIRVSTSSEIIRRMLPNWAAPNPTKPPDGARSPNAGAPTEQVTPGSGNIVRTRPPGSKNLPAAAGGMNAPNGKDQLPPVPPPKPVPQITRESFNSFVNLAVGDQLWGDPQSAQDAVNMGSLPKEVIFAGAPPAALFPSAILGGHADFPEPYRTMVKDLVDAIQRNRFRSTQNPFLNVTGQELTTRLPYLQDGKTRASDPLPPVPWDRSKPWKFAETPPARKDISATDGYAFNLRTLFAAALSDPGAVPEPPDTSNVVNPNG